MAASPALERARSRATGRSSWWLAEDSQSAARDMMAAATSIEVWSYQRRFANLAYARMASGRDMPTVYGLSMSRGAGGLSSMALEFLNFRSPTFNVIGSAIETLTNKLGRNRVWVQFLSDGGTYQVRRAGRRMTDYVDGLFYGNKVHRETKQCLKDCLTWGSAFLKVDHDGAGNIVFERVIPDELLVDDYEAIRRRHRSLYQRTFVSRESLYAEYVDGVEDADTRAANEAAIYGAQGALPGLTAFAGVSSSTSMVALVDGWHLGDESIPGRHILGVGGLALIDEPWERPHFPFAEMRYEDMGFGFWAQGMAEILAPYQKEINRLCGVIAEAQRRVAVPRVVVTNNSGVTNEMLGNAVGGVIRKNATTESPTFITPPAMPPEIYSDLAKWKQWAFERAGVSADDASGLANEKVRSGEAERVRIDEKTGRFICLGQAYEDFHVDIATLALELAAELKIAVDLPGRDPMKWSDAATDLAKYRIKAFPISSFPSTPAARLERASEMLARNEISREDYARVIDYPDVKALMDLETAAADNIDRSLSLMLDGGKYQPPDRYMDLGMALKTAHAFFERERSMGTPDEELEKIRVFIDQTADLLSQSTTPPAAPAPQTVLGSSPNGPQAQTLIPGAGPGSPLPAPSPSPPQGAMPS